MLEVALSLAIICICSVGSGLQAQQLAQVRRLSQMQWWMKRSLQVVYRKFLSVVAAEQHVKA